MSRLAVVLTLLAAQPAPPPDANPALRGLVNTGSQAFGGIKTFNDAVYSPLVDAGTVKADSGYFQKVTTQLLECPGTCVATSELSGTITNAQLASSYSGVGACSSHTFASTLNGNAAPTCTQAGFTDISGTATDGQLVSSYSGVGACSAHQWVNTETRNASPGCTQPAYSDISGCVPASSSAQVQYANGSCMGGISNVTSDGTHTIYSGEALPSAPSSGSTAFDLAYGLVQVPMRRDNFMGVPVPMGLYRGGTIAQLGTAANWKLCVNYPSQWNSTSIDLADGCASGTLAAEGSGASGGGWSTSLTGRMRRVGFSTSTGNTWVGVHRGNLADGEWTGNAAGVGGFLFWTRFVGVTHETGDGTFAGVAATAGAFPNGSRPGQQLNTAYVGCDSTDSNLQVCSNDGTTTSCTALSASFPCRTNATVYDVLIAYPPNSALPDGGTGFGYYVERLDSAAVASGSKSSNLPSNSVQLTPHVVFQSPDGGTLTTKIEITHAGSLAGW